MKMLLGNARATKSGVWGTFERYNGSIERGTGYAVRRLNERVEYEIPREVYFANWWLKTFTPNLHKHIIPPPYGILSGDYGAGWGLVSMNPGVLHLVAGKATPYFHEGFIASFSFETKNQKRSALKAITAILKN